MELLEYILVVNISVVVRYKVFSRYLMISFQNKVRGSWALTDVLSDWLIAIFDIFSLCGLPRKL